MGSTAATHESRTLLTRWILNTRLDLALFVGTPVLIVPVLMAASQRFSSEDLFLIVSTFGALGHHAPGLMRAYGDRQLFRRFWLRFTLVPIVTLTVFTAYSLQELPGVVLVLLFWGLWHFLMQTYGFARIYDARARSFDAVTRRLDLAVCIGWSGTCILFAPGRTAEFLSLALKSGLEFVLTIPLDTLRMLWLTGTVLATFLFFINVLRKVRRGESVNLVKILLFITTFSFFWVCAVNLTNLLLGIAMFELFHDIQYLGIVWMFNRNRVEKEPDVGLFTRFLFRPRRGLPAVYLALVLAYGFIGFAAERLTSESFQHVLFAIVATSNVLHFYFDGFIWKIREPETGSALGVATDSSARFKMPSWFVHASKWGVLLAVVGGCMAAQQSSSMTTLQQAKAIADRVPDSITAQETLAKELVENGNHVEAIRVCRVAEQSDRSGYRTHMYLGVALTAAGQPKAGFTELERALELNPRDAFLRFHLAMGHIRRKQYKQALEHLQASVAIKPDDPIAQYNLGVLNLILKQSDDAITSLNKAVEFAPEYAEAYRSLGEAYRIKGETDVAIGHLEKSLRLESNDPVTYQAMAMTQHAAGQLRDAAESAFRGASLARKQGAGALAGDLDRLAEQYSAEANTTSVQ